MALHSVNRNVIFSVMHHSRRLLWPSMRQRYSVMTFSRKCLSTLDRKRWSVCSPPIGLHGHTIARYEHEQKLIDLKYLKLPKTLIGMPQKIKLWWYLGSRLDLPEFFKGVAGAFTYVTKNIADGNFEALKGLLTEDAQKDVPYYMDDARSRNLDLYQVKDSDIVLIKVIAVGLDGHEEFQGQRDVNVLTMYVWIAYMRDCLKTLEHYNPSSDESWGNIRKQVIAMQKTLQEKSYHAEFQFQRVYDSKYEKALSDWFISQVTYKITKKLSEY